MAEPGEATLDELLAGVERDLVGVDSAVDAARGVANLMGDEAERVRAGARQAHAEMGDEAFYALAESLAGVVVLLAMQRRLQLRRDLVERTRRGDAPGTFPAWLDGLTRGETELPAN